MFRRPLDEIQLPDDLSPKHVRDWIHRICQTLGTTPTALAKLAQVSPSNINRFLASEDPTANLGARTIDRLFQAAGKLQFRRMRTAKQEDADPTERPDPDAFWMASVPVAGIVVGDDRSLTIHPLDDSITVSVPLFGRYGGRTIGYLIDSETLAPDFPRRCVVIGCEIEGLTPHPGDRLLMSRWDAVANRTEVSIRRCVISPNGDCWLVSVGTVRAPDVYLGKPAGDRIDWANNPEWKIEHLLIASVRPELSQSHTTYEESAKKGLQIGAK